MRVASTLLSLNTSAPWLSFVARNDFESAAADVSGPTSATTAARSAARLVRRGGSADTLA
jgi:hypothetical protein